jgi:alkaline phosphatase D
MAGSVTSSILSEIATSGVGLPALVIVDPQAYKAANQHIARLDSSTHGYNVLEITPTQLTCRMQPVNRIKVREGAAKGNPSIFVVPKD